jgi:hypothetical protein
MRTLKVKKERTMNRSLFQKLFLILISMSLFVLFVSSNAEACKCLTRTPGFWGTHPDITAQFLSFGDHDYLPVCGKKLTTVDLGSCSAIQAMCVANGTVKDDEQTQMSSLIRQIAAARLNLRATWSQHGGCTDELENMVGTCDVLCKKVDRGILSFDDSKSDITDCIDSLNDFNNMMDTLPDFGPFINPGPANSATCTAATKDSILTHSCSEND